MEISQTPSIILKGIEFIPRIIEGTRNGIIKILDLVNLPSETFFPIVALVLSFYLALKMIRQWSVVSIFTRASTFLNYVLISLLIFLVLNYVGIT